MQISVENIGKLERRIHITIPEKGIKNEIKDRLKVIANTTRIQGFRRGRVPLTLIQSRYGGRVRQEVVNETIRKTLHEALTQKNLRPTVMPQIDIINDQRGSDLSYTASLEIYPEIELAPLDKIEIEKPIFSINEKDIDKAIEALRKQHRQLDVVDRAAAIGDMLNIHFEGKIDGQPFTGNNAQDYDIELGDKHLTGDFTEALIGKTANEDTTVTQTLPNDYHDKMLRGKKAVFNIHINAVKASRLPEINETLFEKLGIKEGGLDAFRAAVRENIMRSAEQAARNRLKRTVLEALLAINPIELPKSLINQEKDKIKKAQQDAGRPVKELQYGADSADLDPLQQEARRRVALQLILADIINKNQIKADAAKVRAMIESMAINYEEPAAFTSWYYSDQKKIAAIEALVLEEGAVDWVVERAKITEKNYSFDQLMQ